jgi:hypothetical protein
MADLEEKDKNTGNEDSKNTGSENSGDEKGKEKEEVKTYSKEELDGMLEKGKNQGMQSILKKLGLKELSADVEKQIKEFLDSKKTDEQKKAEAAVNENKALEEANNRALAAEVKAEAMQAGAQPQFVDDIVTLVMAKKTDGELDIKTSISELKTKYSVWFESKTDEEKDKKEKGKNVGSKGTGSSVSTGKDSKSKDDKNLGARLAANRKKSGNKKSYWAK